MKLHKLEIIHLYQRNIITNKLEYLWGGYVNELHQAKRLLKIL
jgi:hypothetical protein